MRLTSLKEGQHGVPVVASVFKEDDIFLPNLSLESIQRSLLIILLVVSLWPCLLPILRSGLPLGGFILDICGLKSFLRFHVMTQFVNLTGP